MTATPPDPASTPPTLASIQRTLGELFRRSTPLDDHPDAAVRDAVAELVAGNVLLTPHEQAEIYREQFWLRHYQVLRDDFPALEYLLGEEAFAALCRAYLEAFPPDSWTLRDLGLRMGEHAANYQGFDDEVRGPAVDLARFEAAFVDVFDGPDVEPLPLAAVERIAPDEWARASLELHPGLVLLALDHPVQTIRSGVREKAEPSREVPREPTCVAIYRGPDLKVHYLPLEPEEHRLLCALRGGASLLDACNAAAADLPPDEHEAFAARLRTWFQAWAARGWFVGVAV